MSTTGDFAATEGTGKNAATYTFTEDAVTKFLQRVALSGSDGNEIGGTSADAAWASGNGTFVSLLKAIATAVMDVATDRAVAPHQPCDLIPFTPVLDTSGAYAVGDVLFATASLSMMRANNLRVALMSMTVVDKTKQHPGFTIFFYQTNVTSAAANAANNLSDTDALSYMGHVSVATADWKDLANNSFACYPSINLLLEAATGSTNVYMVGVIDSGTPTFALGDLQIGFGVVQS